MNTRSFAEEVIEKVQEYVMPKKKHIFLYRYKQTWGKTVRYINEVGHIYQSTHQIVFYSSSDHKDHKIESKEQLEIIIRSIQDSIRVAYLTHNPYFSGTILADDSVDIILTTMTHTEIVRFVWFWLIEN